MSVVSPRFHLDGPLLGAGGAAYNRRNVESQRDYDPARQRRSYVRKESQQWARPLGPQHFQQYSQVLNESATDEPNQRRTQAASYQFLAQHSPNSRTEAVRAEHKYRHTRADGNTVRYSSTSVKVQSYTSHTSTTSQTSASMEHRQDPLAGWKRISPTAHAHNADSARFPSNQHKFEMRN